MAVNIAVYFAQLGRDVVLVDADPTDSNLHTHFGCKAARVELDLAGDPVARMREALVPTSVPGLSLLPAAHDALASGPSLRAGRKARWLGALRGLAVDYVVIDAGPGHGDGAVDVMLAADVPIAVAVPEPPAVEATYRFLRAMFRRRLRRALCATK